MLFEKLFKKYGWNECQYDKEIYRDEKGYYQKCLVCKNKKYLDNITLEEMKNKSLSELLISKVDGLQLGNITDAKTDLSCPNCKSKELTAVDPKVEMNGLVLMECKICKERCYKSIDKESE